MSRDLVRACAIGRAASLRRGPGPAGVRADGLFSPAGWDTPTWAQATCGGRVPTCRANACGGRPAATSVSRPASAHGLRKSGQPAGEKRPSARTPAGPGPRRSVAARPIAQARTRSRLICERRACAYQLRKPGLKFALEAARPGAPDLRVILFSGLAAPSGSDVKPDGPD